MSAINDAIADLLFTRRIEKMGLTFVVDFVKKNNPNIHAYHNTEHMVGVARIALMLWDAELYGDQIDETGFSIEQLVVACLFHDFDHSGGAQPDADNIEDALLSIEELIATRDYESEHLYYHIVNNNFLGNVERLIRVTEFPFVRTPVSTAEKIIRDADILYTFQSNTGPIVKGLFDELKACGKLPAEMTFAEFLNGQEKFLSEIEFFTATGKAIRDTHYKQVIEYQKAFCVLDGIPIKRRLYDRFVEKRNAGS